MKAKYLCLSLIPLLLMSCGKKSDGNTDKYETKTINVHYINSSYDTMVDIRYYNDGHIPYISLKDFHQLLYRGQKYKEGRDKFEITRNGSNYVIKTDGGGLLNVHIEENNMTSPDLWLFKNTNLSGSGPLFNASYDGLPFTRIKDVTEDDTNKKEMVIDFNKYNMKIYDDKKNTAVYVPITFATDLFSNENILQGAYNNNDLFFYYLTNNENLTDFGALYYDSIFNTPMTEDYAEFVYNELCLDYDYFLGRPGRSSLEVYYGDYLSEGLDKALSMRPFGRTIKEYLKSTDIAKFLAGASLLGYLRNDGGHSGYNPLSTNYYYKNGSAVFPKWVTDEIINQIKQYVSEESSKNYEELINYDRGYGHRNEVYMSRSAKLNKKDLTLKGTDTYTKDGDIAFIHIDGFMGEIELRDEWDKYYNGERNDIPFGKNLGGAVGAIHYGLTEASKDNEIKHIVIDLAANSGGSTDEMLFMINALTGSNKFYTHNTMTNTYNTATYEFDLNFDRKFDENDNFLNLIGDRDISVLTTRNGFSCGGISPIYLHDEGLFTIGEECGGGSCSVYMQYDGYGNLNRASSPSQTVNKTGISIDIARNSVCDYKIDFPTNGSNNALDYSNLYDAATLRALIEEHYA